MSFPRASEIWSHPSLDQLIIQDCFSLPTEISFLKWSACFIEQQEKIITWKIIINWIQWNGFLYPLLLYHNTRLNYCTISNIRVYTVHFHATFIYFSFFLFFFLFLSASLFALQVKRVQASCKPPTLSPTHGNVQQDKPLHTAPTSQAKFSALRAQITHHHHHPAYYTTFRYAGSSLSLRFIHGDWWTFNLFY